MMSEHFDDDDDDVTTEEVLDMHWSEGPLAQARQNLNIFCSGILMQRSLRLIIEETQMLEDIINDSNISIVDKVSAQQTLALLTQTWVGLVDQLGYKS